ncbi:hypothetical protein OV450_1329 [Actinobacteria bacterium OV450]|nr:hypothetical protein OV450_1329 [Actinobacteria bacterium OV450]
MTVAARDDKTAALEPRRIPQSYAEAQGYMRWWDRFYSQPLVSSPELTVKELAQFVRRVHPEPGQRMVDVGCGEGGLAAAVGRLGVAVTGYDWSSEAVKLAKRFKSPFLRFGAHDFSGYITDVRPAGVEDGSLDIVACRMSLQYLNADEFVQEVRRWLVPETGSMYVMLPVVEREPGTKQSGLPEAAIERLREGWAYTERWYVDAQRIYTALLLRGPGSSR